ncbi:MAG: hypothetical protein MUE72_02540, partial [Chitinophagaceae bacterium]|nr:hypothetical protein [Chitinophagaceae bacterium]
MRKMILMLLFIITALTSNAQSKVFKEVSDEIASTVRVLMQDKTLVGYLTFTRLEAIAEDSFSYKITIMDENLNDIGTVSFKEVSLQLHDVSFENDVICLSYFKSNFLGKQMKNRKELNKLTKEAKFYTLLQFMDLTGKIFKTNETIVNTKPDQDTYAPGDLFSKSLVGYASLAQPMQIANVQETGFSVFYGDDESNYLSLYNFKGDEIWKKKIVKDKQNYFTLFTSKNDVYLLKRSLSLNANTDNQVTGYSVKDNAETLKYSLKDSKTGNRLQVINFNYDPITKMPYLTGMIVSTSNTVNYSPTAKQLNKGFYKGVFTINFTGSTRKSLVEKFSYWSDESKEPMINTKGRFADTKCYFDGTQAFKDFSGNTYFVGTGVRKKPKIGSMISTLVTLPFILPPIIIAGGGYNKYAAQDAMIIKQNAKGELSLDNTIEADKIKIIMKGSSSVSAVDRRSYYHVMSEENKTNFIIMKDASKIIIY